MNRELAASHALSLYGARAEALLEPRKCQGWDLHTQPGTLSRINASTAARDPVCWLGSEARVHSDVRCHMWQLKTENGTCRRGVPWCLLRRRDVRWSDRPNGGSRPEAGGQRRAAGSLGCAALGGSLRNIVGSVGPPSGRQQGEKLSDRIRGPLPRSIPHGHPAGSGPHRSIRFQADGGTRQVIRANSPRANRRANRTGRLLQVVLVTVAVARCGRRP